MAGSQETIWDIQKKGHSFQIPKFSLISGKSK